jgi:AcrR family transcriptional regulator
VKTTADADNRRRQDRGDRRRQQILDAAVELFAAKGFRGTALTELAGRVGTTNAGLLYYFGSKQRLLDEVVGERQVHEQADLLAAVDPDASLPARLAEIVRHNVVHEVFIRLYVVLAAENLDEGDPLHGFFVERYETARRLVRDALDAAGERGELRDGVDAEQISCEVVATLLGLEQQWLMDSARIDLVARIDAYADALTTRLAPT